MKSCRITCGLLASLGALGTVFADSTKSFQQCVTRYGSTKNPNPSTSTVAKTFHLTLPGITTVTPVATKTPSTTVTTTVTSVSSTTAQQATDTFTTTLTNTETDTSTLTQTSTVTEIDTLTTTSFATVTVPTSAGFTPVASEAAVIAGGGGSLQRKRSTRAESRQANRESFAVSLKRGTSNSGNILCPKKGLYPPKTYVQSVQCVKVVQVFTIAFKTITARTTKTVSAPTKSITSTSTVVSTSTVSLVDASTTVTATTSTTATMTITATTTTTTTSTSTETFMAPVATTYAGCQSDNLIDAVGGNSIGEIGATGYFSSTVAASGYDCCVLCQQSPSCQGFGHYGSYCFLSNPTNPTCDPSSIGFSFGAMNGDHSTGIVVGNSNCGQGSYSGAF